MREAPAVMLLATQAEPQMLKHAHPNLGRLVQTRHFSSIEQTARRGICWAADNDAFGGWDEARAAAFERMLDRLAGLSGCRFVTSPDVVDEADLWRMSVAVRSLKGRLLYRSGMVNLEFEGG